MSHKKFLWSLAVVYGLWNLWRPAPIQAQLFQNSNTSCEDKVVVGLHDVGTGMPAAEADTVSNSISCGRFDDNTASGNPDFPDCATQMDPVPQETPVPSMVNQNSVLINTGAHGQNCVNAGEPNSQFADAVDLSNQTVPEGSPFPRFGTIQSGVLDGAGFDDLAWVFASSGGIITPDDRAVQFLFSNLGGGFTPGPFTPDGDSLLGQHPPVTSLNFPYPSDFFSDGIFGGNNAAERSMVLFDCDGDGVDEAATGTLKIDTGGPSLSLGFVVSPNSGSGLLDAMAPADFFTLPTPVVESSRISLTQGDFDGDGILDVMAAVDTDATDGAGNDLDTVVLCPGDGACGFSCPAMVTDPGVFNLSTACDAALPGCTETSPTSITSGDFDGNGLPDVAVAETEDPPTDVRYLLNNGLDLVDWETVRVPQNGLLSTDSPLVVATGKFSDEAFATGTDEVAVTLRRDLGVVDLPSQVAVMTSDGAGGINSPLRLNFAPAGTMRATSLAANDFDHCGGDDIIALGSTDAGTSSVVRRASLFLNTNEAPVVTIAPVPPGIVSGVPFNVSTTCTDPTLDERTFQWSVISQPPGATVVFGTPSGSLIDPDVDASTTFVADQQGEYTIEITCTDFCGLSDDDLNQIRITFNVGPVLTQGANLFDCHLDPAVEFSGGSQLWPLLILLAALASIWFLLARPGRSNP